MLKEINRKKRIYQEIDRNTKKCASQVRKENFDKDKEGQMEIKSVTVFK